MNEYIIDVTKEGYKDIPITVNGEVLLERTLDNDGNITGYLTISVEKLINLKDKILTDPELSQSWDKYKYILDSF